MIKMNVYGFDGGNKILMSCMDTPHYSVRKVLGVTKIFLYRGPKRTDGIRYRFFFRDDDNLRIEFKDKKGRIVKVV